MRPLPVSTSTYTCSLKHVQFPEFFDIGQKYLEIILPGWPFSKYSQIL
jgi:hypothetical protein